MDIPVAIPKASSDPLPEIATFLEPFAPLFRRVQSQQSLERYVTGLLTDLDRKNCDTIAAAAVAGTSTERLQHLLTDAEWDSRELDGARVRSLSIGTLLNMVAADSRRVGRVLGGACPDDFIAFGAYIHRLFRSI